MNARRRLLLSLLGALTSAWTVVTLAAAFGPTEPLLGGPLWNWLIVMVLGTLHAIALTLVALLCDVLLSPWRAGPRGWRAFVSAAIAEGAVVGGYLLFRPGDHTGVLFWVALFGPLALFAGLARLLWSTSKSPTS